MCIRANCAGTAAAVVAAERAVIAQREAAEAAEAEAKAKAAAEAEAKAAVKAAEAKAKADAAAAKAEDAKLHKDVTKVWKLHLVRLNCT